ncbi:UROD/MetE-like protein, partial [Suillus weaverae]
SREFSLCDYIPDHSAAFNAIPKHYQGLGLMFSMGCDHQTGGVDDVPTCKMKEIVVQGDQLLYNKDLGEYKEAKEAGIITRPVILSPISYLVLGKASKEAPATFQPLLLLPKILPVYKPTGVESVQINEPILVFDKGANLNKQYAFAYAEIVPIAPKIILTTYFNHLDSNINFITKLPIADLHIDLIHAPQQLGKVLSAIKSTLIMISLGVVSAQTAIAALSADHVIIVTSSSLLHAPVTFAYEMKLTEQQRAKASKVATIAAVLSGSQDPKACAALEVCIAKCCQFESTLDDAVRKCVADITPDICNCKSPFATHKEVQAKHLNLPKLPTTTIGSFPQIKEICTACAKLNKGEISEVEYDEFIRKEIVMIVKFQEKVNLDLVHGEPEYNDMVQYFGEQLNGFIFTQNTWVQSCGSHLIILPTVVFNISCPKLMTIKWSSYAQSVSTKTMKGMLSDPVTILNSLPS